MRVDLPVLINFGEEKSLMSTRLLDYIFCNKLCCFLKFFG